MVKNIKTKRISITTLDKIMKEKCTSTKSVIWNDVEISVQRTLPYIDVLNFVNLVVRSCFDTETNEYFPEVKAFAIRCCVLEKYANFSLPSNIERRYDLVYNTDAYETVIQHINANQFNEILDAIDKKVENLANANVAAINKQINTIYNMFNSLQEQFNEIFSGITPEDASKFMQTIADGKFDEEKLVQAYMAQSKEVSKGE